MSNLTPSIYHAVPVSSTKSSSVWPWVIVIIILIIVIIALAIWLAVRHTSDSSGGNGRKTAIQGGEITASSSTITGSWKALADEEDKVTLYVSTNPITINNDGTVSDTTVKPASATGSNNSVSISGGLTVNTIYNAVLIATGNDTTHYSVYGPQKVITQETTQIKDWIFTINNLNNPLGAVSENGHYTEKSTDVGVYGINESHYLVRYDDSEISDRILCRYYTSANKNSTEVILAEIAENGKIYPEGAEQATVNEILPSYCQWNYNDVPPSTADGRNQWCLRATQSTTTDSTAKEVLCLAANGSALDVTTLSEATIWYNNQFGDKPTS